MSDNENLGDGLQVLVAEDDLVCRAKLETILTASGFRVKSVENGRQALDCCSEEYFPVVITDWMMPEMDGIELCRSIRAHAAPGYTFLILLTAKEETSDVVQGLDAGADDFLSKPFNGAELIARMKAGLRILELERSMRKAHAEIKMLSITDPLTGCYNRGYIEEFLPKEILRALRYNQDLSIILCDIDYFKRVNDNHGHAAGDTALKQFVIAINDSIRVNIDWLARYGGEEFLLVTPNTGYQMAAELAERLRKSVSERELPLGRGNITLTVSFGVTGIAVDESDHSITAAELIAAADRYLYTAKEGGRNRVEAGPFVRESA